MQTISCENMKSFNIIPAKGSLLLNIGSQKQIEYWNELFIFLLIIMNVYRDLLLYLLIIMNVFFFGGGEGVDY